MGFTTHENILTTKYFQTAVSDIHSIQLLMRYSKVCLIVRSACLDGILCDPCKSFENSFSEGVNM